MNIHTELIITPNSMRVKGGNLNFTDATRLLLSAQRKLTIDILNAAPPEDRLEYAKELYDALNAGYGKVLLELFPEFHNAETTEEVIAQRIEEENRQLSIWAEEIRTRADTE